MPTTTYKEAKNNGEIRLIGIADSHLTCFDPPSWKTSFLEESENILDQVFNFAVKMRVDAIVHAGDVFHLKSPARNPLHFISWVLKKFQWLKERGIEVWGIGGNHDLKYGSLEGLGGQPLEVLIQAGLFHLLDHEELVIEAFEDGPTRAVPQTLIPFTLRVSGASYDHGRAESSRDKKRDGETHHLTLGHYWFTSETGEFLGEPAYGPDYLGKGDADVFFIGHHHEMQGVQHVGGKWYVAHGSINRTGGRESDLVRRPAASLLTFKLGRPEPIDIKILYPKVKPANEVIDFEVRKQMKEEQKSMDEFIQTLHSTEIKNLDPKDALAQMDVTQEVRERAQGYIEEAERNV